MLSAQGPVAALQGAWRVCCNVRVNPLYESENAPGSNVVLTSGPGECRPAHRRHTALDSPLRGRVRDIPRDSKLEKIRA
jgi:hypothetical protein